MDALEPLPPLPTRLVTDDDLKALYEVMKLYDMPKDGAESNAGAKRKGQYVGGLETQHYGRGKRAREVYCLYLTLVVIACSSQHVSMLHYPFFLISIFHLARYALMKSNGQKRNLRSCVRLNLQTLLR